MSEAVEKIDWNTDPRKAKAIQAWRENPSLSNKAVAELAGVSDRTINRWRTDPEFVSCLVSESRLLLNSRLPQLYDVCVDKALKGDWRFMKLILDHVEMIEQLQRDVVAENTFIIQWNSIGVSE